MSAGKNIHSAHTEVEKTLVDRRNLKGAKERTEYLTPGVPQSYHMLIQRLVNTFQSQPDLDEDQQAISGKMMVSYLSGIPVTASSFPAFSSQLQMSVARSWELRPPTSPADNDSSLPDKLDSAVRAPLAKFDAFPKDRSYLNGWSPTLWGGQPGQRPLHRELT